MGTPTFVQHVAFSYEEHFPGGDTIVNLPNATQAGNFLVIGVSSDVGNVLTVSDNVGTGTWTPVTALSGAQLDSPYYMMNTPAGIKQITITGTTGFVAVVVTEFFNVATSGALRTSNNNTSTAPNIDAGSVTPTAGDLIWMWAHDVGAAPSTSVTGITKGTGYTKISSQIRDAQIVQYRIAAGGAQTPSATVSGGTDSFQGFALVFIPGTSGQQNPQTPRIQMIQQDWLAPSSTSAARTFDFPCTGNCPVIQYIGEGTGTTDFTVYTDSNSNTWQQATVSTIPGGLGNCQQLLAPNATCTDSMRVTLTNRGTTSASFESVFFMYDIIGAATSPLGLRNTTTGTQSVNANLSVNSITPSVGSLVLFLTGIDSHTVLNCATPATYIAHMPVCTGSDGNAATWATTNGWGNVNNATGSPLTMVWTIQGSGVPAGVGVWASNVMEIKGAPTISPYMGRMLLVNP